jgi:hypothetical protein
VLLVCVCVLFVWLFSLLISHVCISSLAGTFSDTGAATICLTCGPGTYSSSGASACTCTIESHDVVFVLFLPVLFSSLVLSFLFLRALIVCSTSS